MAIDFTEKYVRLVMAGVDIEKVPEKYRERVRERMDTAPERREGD